MKTDKYMIMGRNCLSEILRSAPERVKKLYTAKPESDPLVQKAKNASIHVVFKRKDELSHLVGSDSHQSYIAEVKPKAAIDVRVFLEEDHDESLVLMLDNINDPQNLGALLRAAECFGVDLVVWSKNRGCSITPVVTKASVGASEIIDIAQVSNLAETVKKFQKAGYEVVTCEVGKEATELRHFSFSKKTVVIMGSEGKGIQPLVSKLADAKVYIPMYGMIDSLNVSQATAVILSHYKK